MMVDESAGAGMQRFRAYRTPAMVDFAGLVLPNEETAAAILSANQTAPTPAADIVASLPAAQKAMAFRGLAWLVKLDLLRVA